LYARVQTCSRVVAGMQPAIRHRNLLSTGHVWVTVQVTSYGVPMTACEQPSMD
jgi:hypothetical protein